MKKSIVFPAFFPKTVIDADYFIEKLQYVNEKGFYNTIEFFFEGSESDKKRIKEALERSNMNSIFLGAYYLKTNGINLGNLSHLKRNDAITITKKLVDEAFYYGSEKMMVVSGKNVTDKREAMQSFENLTDSLYRLCDYTDKLSENKTPSITLEHFNHIGEPYFLVGPTVCAVKLARKVKNYSSNFELTFDLSHIYQLKEDLRESFKAAVPYTNHIHLANCVTDDSQSPLFGDKHPPFDIPGGDVSSERLMEFLKDLSLLKQFQDFTIGIEIIPAAADLENAVFEKGTEVFKKSINTLESSNITKTNY